MENYGKEFTIMQKEGYDGQNGLGKNKQEILEPVQPRE